MIKLFLVDDQPNVRYGLRLRLALESDLMVVGEAGDGAMALTLIPHVQPDVALIDVEMPGMNGLALAEALRQVVPQCAIIILSLYDDAVTRQKAHVAGAVAFVTKQAGATALLAAIRGVHNRI